MNKGTLSPGGEEEVFREMCDNVLLLREPVTNFSQVLKDLAKYFSEWVVLFKDDTI
ncbi:MAG TPA: hypothetical protein PLH24_02325 [Candidatus Atribacteria bacterium]|nr:hypothetical protein [Candidatus Atribacteria bacterium]HPT63092.1 hypothetical protein [Candidatus Atribacteria bacterium]HPZ40605.1 hypothetical protein [Candidatus Atribacteria bacterium]